MKYPALVLVTLIALASCKPDGANQASALNAVDAASSKAEAAKIAASKTEAAPAAAVDYAAALEELEEAKRTAKDAGADQREIETRESLGRTHATFKENARKLAASEREAERRREKEEIEREGKARIDEIAAESEARLKAIQATITPPDPNPPPAKPSSVPGLPDGTERAGKEAVLPPGMTKE